MRMATPSRSNRSTLKTTSDASEDTVCPRAPTATPDRGGCQRGRVVALDHSQAMLAQARRRLAAHADRISNLCADLGVPLPIERVDAVLSTATLHWVGDHDALFGNLGQVLRPGGRLVAQCGGVGNIASVRAALAQLGVVGDGTYFATPAETERRLAAADFVDARAWLQPEPTPFDSAEALGTYLATIVLRAPLAALPETERPAFVRAEERFPVDDLRRVTAWVARAARGAGVPVVTGDTKVVGQGRRTGCS